jgi:hypothetical protein
MVTAILKGKFNIFNHRHIVCHIYFTGFSIEFLRTRQYGYDLCRYNFTYSIFAPVIYLQQVQIAGW